jgi:hypothetical protein
MRRKYAIAVVGRNDANGMAHAYRLGQLLGDKDWVVIIGGRNDSVMAQVNEGVKKSARKLALTHGILPSINSQMTNANDSPRCRVDRDAVHVQGRLSCERNLWKLKAILLAVLFGACLQSAARADQPAFKFVDPTVHLATGANAGTGELRLRAEVPASNDKKAEEPTLADFELPKPLAASVIFGKPVEITAQDDKNRTWRIDVRVDGLTAANTLQRRYATVSWAGKSWIVEYFLSNQPAAEIKFDTNGIPSDWNISDSSCISFRVLASPPGLTGVGFATNLVEDTTKTIFPSEKLHLWDERGYRSRSLQQTNATEESASQSQIDEAATNGEPLYLCSDQGLDQYGHFAGTLILFAAQKPEGKSQSVSIYSSRWKWVGYLLIIIGSVAAYIVKVYLPATIARSRELEPALFLRRQLADIASVVSGLSPQTKAALQETPDKIESIQKDLSTSSLDSNHFLHRVPPIPFNENVDTNGYMALLRSGGTQVAALSVVVRDGLVRADQRRRTTTQKDQQLVDQACKDIDDALASAPLPSIEQLQKQTRDRIKKLDDDIARANQNQFAVTALASQEDSGSMSWERIEFSIDRWSGTIWVIWTVLVAAVGIVYLVWNNLSFGRPQDFLYCLLWGFGITAAGQQITAGLITTGLGVTLPKTS